MPTLLEATVVARVRRLARILPAWLALTVSCQRGEPPRAATTVADSAGGRITTITLDPSALAAWTLATRSDLTLTGAETGDSSAFAHVGSVRWLGDGRIVVADVAARRLLLFDADGRFVRSLGRSGDGPGEFRWVGALTLVTGDSIATFDARLRRLSLWHPDRGFIRGVAVGGSSLESAPTDAWAWRDHIVVLQAAVTPLESVPPAAGVRRWPMRAHLALLDSVGGALGTSPTFDGMYTGLYDGGDARLPFSHQPFAAVARDRVYFGSGADFAISYMNADFQWKGEIRWPGQREKLSPEEVDSVRGEAMALARGRLPPEQLAARLATNFAGEVLPEYRPAIGRVLVDDTDRLWVERFEATRLGSLLQKAGDRFTVLSAAGEPVARLTLPPATRLEDIRGNRALLVVRDSLDVQTVVVREIVKR